MILSLSALYVCRTWGEFRECELATSKDERSNGGLKRPSHNEMVNTRVDKGTNVLEQSGGGSGITGVIHPLLD